MRILFAEDEEDLNRIVTAKMKSEGFSVDSCLTGTQAIELLVVYEYDVAVLDIMLPGTDGYSILKKLQQKQKGCQVLFLTARDSIADRILGLDSGASDYLVKPFSLDELMARIRVLTRRAFQESGNLLQAAPLSMDLVAHEVRVNGTLVNLSPKEFQLLEYLLLNQGIVLSREKIEDHIWNMDYEGGTNVVDVYISYLRKKLEEPFGCKLIHTIRGAGYRLQADQQGFRSK